MQRFRSQIASLAGVRVAVGLLTFVTGVVVARILGPEGKGTLAVIVSAATVASVVGGFGIPNAVPHLTRQRRFSYAEILGCAMFVWGLVLLAGAVALAIAQLTGTGLPDDLRKLPPEVVWLGYLAIPGLLVTTVLGPILIVEGRMRFFAVWQVVVQATTAILTWILVAYARLGVFGAVLAVAIGNIGSVLVFVAWWKRSAIGWPRMERASMIETLRAGGHQYVVSLFANAFKRGEILVVVALLSTSVAGLYSVAVAIYEVVIELPRLIVWPAVSRLLDRDATAAGIETGRVVRIQSLLMLPIIAGAAITAIPVITLFFGEDFRGAGVLFVLLVPGALFRAMHTGISTYFVANGAIGVMLPSVIVVAVVNIGLDLLLIPRFGPLAIAASNVIAEFSMAATSMWIFRRATGVPLRDLIVPKRGDFATIRAALSSR